MKFFHISDLHIGKRVNGFSMLEDQRYILGQILELAQEHHPDGILIAGDLYDKSMPAGAAVCDSEELSVGGLDQVDASAVEGFDYVALGHLHRPQKAGKETIRYCGSPLKYSFSEAGHQKSVTVVEVTKSQDSSSENAHQSGNVSISLLPLTPKLDLREIRDPMEKLLQREVYEAANREGYLYLILTNEDEVMDAIGRLREVYPNIMRLDFEKMLLWKKQRKKKILWKKKDRRSCLRNSSGNRMDGK